MRIDVTEVSGDVIGFDSAVGWAWAPRPAGVRVGDVLEVEVDVPESVGRWEPVDGPDVLVAEGIGSPVRICGVVEAGAGGDRVVGLRCGGSVMLVEFGEGGRPVPGGGERVGFVVGGVEVHPYRV